MIDSITRSTPFPSLVSGTGKTGNADQSFGEILAETVAENDLLKKAPEKWVTEAGFSDDAVKKALEFRRNELELEDPTEYSHELTAEQEAWLLSRHDLSSMQRYVPYTWITSAGTTQTGYKSTVEYSNFVADLAYLGVYSREELVFQTEPIDTRPGSYSTVYEYFLAQKNSGGSLFESSRSIVARLEEMYRYYYERSQDPSRAVKGDAEFAALIKEHYMPFEKEFFEFIDRLLNKDKEQLPPRSAARSVAPVIEDISDKLKEDFGKAFA